MKNKFKVCTVRRFDTKKLIPKLKRFNSNDMNISIGASDADRHARFDTLNNIRSFDQVVPNYIAKTKSKRLRSKFNRMHTLLNQNPNPHNRRVARVLQSLSRLLNLHIRRMTGA